MIQIVAMNGIEIHEKTTDYEIGIVPVESDNGFTSFSGREIRPVMGHKTVISCTLRGVPHLKAQDIARIVKSDSFELTYTTPLRITSKFRCTKYNAVPKNSDPREKNPLVTDKITWNISLILESAEQVVGGVSFKIPHSEEVYKQFLSGNLFAGLSDKSSKDFRKAVAKIANEVFEL